MRCQTCFCDHERKGLFVPVILTLLCAVQHHIDEPSAEEYAAIKKECRGLLLTEGAKGALKWGLSTAALMYGVRKFTAYGKRLTLHPYSIVLTMSVVAPFWIYGATSVTECQRSAYERRKASIGKNFERESFNRQ